MMVSALCKQRWCSRIN